MGGSSWANNNFISLNNNTQHNREFALAVAILGFLILCHSWYLHRRNFNRVRILNDFLCLNAILAGAGVFWSTCVVTQTTIAVGNDLFNFGIAGSFIGVVDLLITYSRFQLLSNPICPHQDLMVGIYIFLFVVLANLTFYTIVPIWVDENEETGLFWVNIFLFYVFCPAIIVFNGVFGIWFFLRVAGLKCLRVVRHEQHPKMLVLAYKSVIHTALSSAVTIHVVASALVNPVQGQLCYCFVIQLTVHVLFNWKIDFWELYVRMKNRSDRTNAHSETYPFDLEEQDIVVRGVASDDSMRSSRRPARAADGVGVIIPVVENDDDVELSAAPSGTVPTTQMVSREFAGSVAAEDQVLTNARRMGFV